MKKNFIANENETIMSREKCLKYDNEDSISFKRIKSKKPTSSFASNLAIKFKKNIFNSKGFEDDNMKSLFSDFVFSNKNTSNLFQESNKISNFNFNLNFILN